ncbi:probable BOI-related E3 ubiquitin-protein ligase 3 [Durio zibethinus]|uniref:Probable BOI-related E3 ubiquitin-protein ligase 3 n=1 Tax=Durio zibethinus TaxID=66656 RepID=A0A6P5XEU3_DURZI|nr:probable BOI-related E3 ubiquitin-protein ligase 3 [Durio zibethinus]
MAIQAQLYSDNIGFTLCGSQDWIDNGCGGGGFNQFCFSLQQKSQLQQLQQQQQLQQLQNQQLRNQSLYFDNSLVPSSLKNNNNNNSNNRELMMRCQTMVSQVENEKQRHEVDQFIRSQNEKLRMLLQEQRRQQVALLVKKIEPKASILLRQKDEEIAKATNKTMELQNLLKKLEMENQAWQRVAQENEAMVVSLNNTLEQLREQASCCFNNGVDDAESCCEVNREGTETEENRGFAGLVADHVQDEERTRKTTATTMVCECCNSRSSCVLFLPCRHLSSCKDCAAFLDSCPVCRTAKKASIEALLS